MPEEEKSKIFDRISLLPVETEEIIDELPIGRNTFFRHQRNENQLMDIDFVVPLVRYIRERDIGIDLENPPPPNEDEYLELDLETRQTVFGAVDRNTFNELTGYTASTLRHYRNREGQKVNAEAYKAVLDYIRELYSEIDFSKGYLVDGETYRQQGGELEDAIRIKNPSWEQIEALFEEGSAKKGAVLKLKFGEIFE